MYKITAKVEGLMCGNCEKHVNEAIKESFSVKKVNSSHTDKETVIVSKEDLDTAKVKAVIEEAGYQVTDITKETIKTFFSFSF